MPRLNHVPQVIGHEERVKGVFGHRWVGEKGEGGGVEVVCQFLAREVVLAVAVRMRVRLGKKSGRIFIAHL